MRKAIMTILVLLVGLVSNASASLVAHYEFAGNFNDSSANGLHGSPNGAPSIISDPDRGEVLSLNGAGQYVVCGADPLFDITGPITVSAWIKVNVFDKNFQAIVTKGEAGWRLNRNAGTNSLEFSCMGLSGNDKVIGSKNVNDDQWHHVAGVYNGSEISLYVDGVLDASVPASGTSSTSAWAMGIGENLRLPGRAWNGLIDDVRIYDHAASPSEIVRLGGQMGTAFTYQGQLQDAGEPADGSYDLEFRLYDDPDSGTQQGNTVTAGELDVEDGYFTVELDFAEGDPNVFNGEPRWLQIGIRPGVLDDPSPYTALSPRQAATPNPYALFALNGGSGGNGGEGDGHSLDAADGDPVDVVYVDNEGHVGIGTTSPSEALEVSGNININSVYRIGGDTVLSNPGVNNIFVGVRAGQDNTSGEGNTFVGKEAGNSNTEGSLNTFVGANAGSSNTTGYDNTFLGESAGQNNTTGQVNTFVGADAGQNNTAGHQNTFIGNYAGYSNTTGYHDVFLGHGAGFSNTTGSSNTFVGRQAGYSNTTGYFNVCLGNESGHSNETGFFNTFVGNGAGYSNTTGNYNTFVGLEAGRYNTTGFDNTFVGSVAGHSNTTGNYNTFVGISAGTSNTIGEHNTFLGVAAGEDNTTGNANTFVGNFAGIDNTTGEHNTFLGYYAGQSNTIGNYNTFLGDGAGYYNTTANGNTFVGNGAGLRNETGEDNAFLGFGAGSYNTTGYDNTFVGHSAGKSNDTGFYNTFVGDDAGYNNTSAGNNLFLGCAAGYSNDTGQYNTYLGRSAGYSNSTGVHNVFIGHTAGYNETGSHKLYIANTNTSTPLIHGDFITKRIGIARVATANTLEVEGDASKTVVGDWLANSDARIKSDVRTVTNALDTLGKVRLVSFEYTDDYRSRHESVEDRRYLNVVAQEFGEVFPDYVKSGGEKLADGEEILQVDSYPLTIYSAAAVQELHSKVKAVIKEKDTEIEALKERMSKMESLLDNLIRKQKGGQP